MSQSKKARSDAFRNKMIEKWRSEIHKISIDVITLNHGRSIYKRLFEIVDANPRIPDGNALCIWLKSGYIISASMAIRRLLDDDENVVSLARLVHSIKVNKHVITKDWWVSQYLEIQEPIVEDKLSREEFCELRDAQEDFHYLVGKGCTSINGVDLERRLEQARSSCKLVIEYADKVMAHTDKRPPDEKLTYSSMDAAIDAIGELFKYLDSLLNQGFYFSLEPLETFPWERLFEKPWKNQEMSGDGSSKEC